MKKKVLVAEDDKAIVEVVTIVLENEGYEVLVLEQNTSVLQHIEKYSPDVILLDIWLFGEDGGKIAKHIKSQTSHKRIPIIMMSANNETERISRASGADDFLLKPFNIDDLLAVIKKHIKS